MRTLAITQNITLDGSIEMLDDWFDPQAGADARDLMEHLQQADTRADALVLGRQTFEDFRGYWPQRTDDSTGVTEYLNAVSKYVVSTTLSDPKWQGTTVLSGDPAQEVLRLKQAPGKDIVVTGSIQLCHALLQAGLVDEVRLYTYPVVQGRGRRLFPDGLEVSGLRLLEATSFSHGITYAAYALM